MEMPTPSTQRNPLISEPFDMVVFGGRGDLAKRKLLPALYELDRDNRLPPDGRIIAVSRGEMGPDDFVKLVEDSCIEFSTKGKPLNPDVWGRFSKRLSYVGMDATKPDGYSPLVSALKDRQAVVRVFYLATALIPAAHCPPPIGEKTNLKIEKNPLNPVCTPRSLWWISPVNSLVRRDQSAISRASSARSVRSDCETCQPTTKREQTSTTKAT